MILFADLPEPRCRDRRSLLVRWVIPAGLALAACLTLTQATPKPGVPLPAVEANELDFGDGPTPFPGPQPPRPRPVPDFYLPAGPSGMYSADQAIIGFSEGATRWKYSGNRLVWTDCADRVASRLADAPAPLRTLIAGIAQDMSPELITALDPLRAEMWREVNAANRGRLRAGQPLLPIERINAVWQARVRHHAREIAASLPTVSGIRTSECDTGRCDCKPCPADHTCACLVYFEGWDDCSVVTRESCNFDDGPDPETEAHTFDLNGE